MDFTELRHLAEQIETECGKAIIGKGEQIRLVLTSLFAGGHVLIDDIPRRGQDHAGEGPLRGAGLRHGAGAVHPDLLPSDIVGMNIYSQKTGEMVFTPGPIMTNILLADEINRAIPRTQSALLEAMEERQVSVDGVTYPLAPPFMVLATQNPVETETTFALPAAQLDRFLFKLSMGLPHPREEAAMLEPWGTEPPLRTSAPCSPRRKSIGSPGRSGRSACPIRWWRTSWSWSRPPGSSRSWPAAPAPGVLGPVPGLQSLCRPLRPGLCHPGRCEVSGPLRPAPPGTAVPSGGALRPGGGRRWRPYWPRCPAGRPGRSLPMARTPESAAVDFAENPACSRALFSILAPGSLRSGLQPGGGRLPRRHLLSGGRRRAAARLCLWARHVLDGVNAAPPGGAELRLSPGEPLSSAGDAGQPQVAAPGLADGALPLEPGGASGREHRWETGTPGGGVQKPYYEKNVSFLLGHQRMSTPAASRRSTGACCP